MSAPRKLRWWDLILSIHRAEKLFNRGRYQEARPLFEDILYTLITYSHPESNAYGRMVMRSVARSRALTLDRLAQIAEVEGDHGKAEEYLSRELEHARRGGNAQVLALALAGQGQFLSDQCRYSEALRMLEEAVKTNESHRQVKVNRVGLLSLLAFTYYRLGYESMALSLSEQAVGRAGGDVPNFQRAHAFLIRGIILGSAGQKQEAVQSFSQCITVSRAMGNEHFEALAVLNQTDSLIALGRLAEAEAGCRKARTFFDSYDHCFGLLRLTGHLGEIEQRRGNLDAAVGYYEQALAIAETSGSFDERCLWCFSLATHPGLKDTERGYEYLLKALGLAESIRGRLLVDFHKSLFAESFQALYVHACQEAFNRGRLEDLFDFSEKMRSRALLDLLQLTLEKIEPRQMGQAQFDRLHELRRQLGELEKQLNEGASPTNPFGARAGVSASASTRRRDQLEAEYLGLLDQIRLWEPDYDSLWEARTTPLSQVQADLPADAAIIEYLIASPQPLALVVSRRGLKAVALEPPVSSDGARVDLEQWVRDLGRSIQETCRLDPRSHEVIRRVSRPLTDGYDALFRPLEPALEGIKQLVIVAHQSLHYLPFHALRRREDKTFLFQHYQIVRSPSASVYHHCFQLDTRAPRNVVIFNPGDPGLPYASIESDGVAEVWGSRARVISGSDVTAWNFREASARADLVHFIGHCYLSSVPEFHARIVLAGGDEMTLEDVMNMRLPPALVTLSACHTGADLITAGDELIGFARAFLHAGASTLVLTLWEVHDRSTARFMMIFNEQLRSTGNAAAASREAMNQLLSDPQTAHPYYWAPFIIIGKSAWPEALN